MMTCRIGNGQIRQLPPGTRTRMRIIVTIIFLSLSFSSIA